MIHQLTYSVTFPSNGRNLSGELSFEPGVTAVTGKNGTGKTFAASELIRYMLFGKKALRGPAADYKTLDASMSATIGGALFQIDRGKKETVKDESGKIVATGAEAVNAFLTERMGFGLDVFDAICAANQKESERLTQLRPAERKRMIDDIVGLGANEAVEKLCREEAKQLRRDADTLRDSIVEAVEPVRPEGYRKADEIFQELREARAVATRRAALEKIIAAVGPAPLCPSEPRPSNDSITKLEEWQRNRDASMLRFDELDRQIKAIPDVPITADELDRIEQWEEYENERQRRGPMPTMSAENATRLMQQWAAHDALKDQERHEATCPKCSHSFLTGLEVPDAPDISMNQLRAEMRALGKWESPLETPPGEAAFLGREKIKHLRILLSKQDEKKAMQAEKAAISFPADRSSELSRARVAAAEWAVYEASISDWNARSAEALEAQAELDTLPPAIDLDTLNAAHTAASIYENQTASYLQAKQRHDELVERIASKVKKADSYKEGAEALKRARAQFKSFLAPSLGKVASALIQQMTNGRLNNVIVDEDMNIAVDGQEVSTLSGAQAAVANIALRLALGRVLFSKIFPVFLGDEIDAYSDEEMTSSTAEALGELRSQLKQIILISHKQLGFADHHIEIGKSPELLAA